jgi:hypothetical protein
VLRARPAEVFLTLPLLTADGATAQEVNNLRDFAQRGEAFGFCLDAAKAVFAYGLAPWIVTSTFLVSAGNVWYEPTASLSANDPVRIETGEPNRISEQNKIPIGGYSGTGAITVSNGITFTQPVTGWLRYAYYWPRLRLFGADAWQVSTEAFGRFERHEIRARIDMFDLASGVAWAGGITTGATVKRTPDDFLRTGPLGGPSAPSILPWSFR